ncbi:glucose-6-phosphate isomerase, partial [[Eubacterium] siraeum]|nr:glucose-6-phosphate isomerase [[Eubacterium] siraeum]
LFGESEGKDGNGLFPASATFSTDLHSLGQFIHDGSNILFETVVHIAKAQKDFFLKNDATNGDGLNFLSNQNMSVVNQKAYEGTIISHTEGGTPNMVLEMP